jgi:hypothetical protein
MRRDWSVALLVAAAVIGSAAACGPSDDPRPACLASVDVDGCTPLYPAEFPVIFSQVLSVTCASAGASCHGATGQQGGLVFVDEAQAYAALLAPADGEPRVVAGDPACSEMMVRLDSPGHAWSMPPGAPLDERARCSIRRWIAAGAPAMPAAGATGPAPSMSPGGAP